MTHLARPIVVIFCDHLLYPSETFIHAQAGALSDFEAAFAGCRRVAGLDLREQRVHVISRGNISGKLQELGFKLFGLAPALVNQLNSLKPVLIHAHYGPNGLRALPLAHDLQIPIVVTFHGSDVTITDLSRQKTSLGFRHYQVNKEKLRRGGDLFLAVSKFIRGKLLEQGFPEERVLVHYTGVDTKKFQPASTEASPVILFVGRLEESKGAEFAIRASAEVQKQLPAAELVLVGDGSLRVDLEKLAKQSLRRYQFVGSRKSDEVREWMNRASVICVPSIRRRSGEEEGFGMVCAEAAAAAKPVVAFYSGGIPEVVRHGSTGYVVPERDWRGMAGCISELLQNPQLRQQFGRAARELALHQFDLEQCTRRLERLYATIIDLRRNQRKATVVHHQIRPALGSSPSYPAVRVEQREVTRPQNVV
jgi:colanic acid/amylovoran biosynthesis glycosyltransferase